MYGCVFSVANRRVECVHHAGCNSVCVSPTTMSGASADGRATRSLDCGAHCSPVRARSRSQRGRRAPTRFLDSGARCSPIRTRSGRAAEHVPWTVVNAAPPSALAPGASAGGTTHSLDSGEAVCTGSGHLFRAFPLPGEKLLCCSSTATLLGCTPTLAASQTAAKRESKRESRIETGIGNRKNGNRKRQGRI